MEREMLTFSQVVRRHDKFQDYMVKCKCSHTILFTGYKDRLLCRYCGRYVYRNKNAEFKYKMKEKLK